MRKRIEIRRLNREKRIEHRLSFRFPPLIRLGPVTRESLPDTLRYLAKSRSSEMKEALARPGLLGAFEVIVPSVTRHKNWRVEVRRLYMTLPGFVAPESWSTSPPETSRTGGHFI